MRTAVGAADLWDPRAHRGELGLTPGPIELVATDSAVSIEPVLDDVLVEEDGLLVVRPTGPNSRTVRHLTEDA